MPLLQSWVLNAAICLAASSLLCQQSLGFQDDSGTPSENAKEKEKVVLHTGDRAPEVVSTNTVWVQDGVMANWVDDRGLSEEEEPALTIIAFDTVW